MAVLQYPHYLYAEKVAAAARDVNGAYIPSSSEWEFVGKCRFESNGKGAEIKTDDSKTIVFSGVAYSQTSENVSNNTRLFIARSEIKADEITSAMVENWAKNPEIVIVGMNLKTDKTQLHTKFFIN